MSPSQEGNPLDALAQGTLALHGEFVWGSNYTFLLDVTCTDRVQQAVYKPTRGARPLWDFPAPTLARHEAAAYVVSEALGWGLVPPTIYRKDGPFGPGSLQLFIDHDPEYHYFNFSDEDRQRLRPVVVFDLLVNNADRKGSHVLLDKSGHIWLIDHGLCFHVEDKLRTVIWDFAGEPVPDNLLADLDALHKKLTTADGSHSSLANSLQGLLTEAEIKALTERTTILMAQGVFPQQRSDRRQYPWPLV